MDELGGMVDGLGYLELVDIENELYTFASYFETLSNIYCIELPELCVIFLENLSLPFL